MRGPYPKPGMSFPSSGSRPEKDIYFNEALCCRCGRDDNSHYADKSRRLSYTKRCGHSLCQACLQQTFGVQGTVRVRGGNNIVKCPAPSCSVTTSVHDYGSKRPDEEEHELELKVRKNVRGMCVFESIKGAEGGPVRCVLPLLL
jgi:hypothetical protein